MTTREWFRVLRGSAFRSTGSEISVTFRSYLELLSVPVRFNTLIDYQYVIDEVCPKPWREGEGGLTFTATWMWAPYRYPYDLRYRLGIE